MKPLTYGTLLVILPLLFGCQTVESPKRATDYLAEANATVTTIEVEEALQLYGDPTVAFIDVRHKVERDSLGFIPESTNQPRGFLEFYMDPTHPRHKEVFSSGKKLVFYCSSGNRSALAAKLAEDMGVEHVVTMRGGLKAWIEAGGAVESVRTEE